MKKRLLSLFLVLLMIASLAVPVWSLEEDPLDLVTKDALTVAPIENTLFLGDKLNLDFEGVTFTSSDEAVIDPLTGIVTRPEETRDITLTAAANGLTKSFVFTIPGQNEDYPVESIVYYDDFEDGILSPHIEQTASSGVAVLENGGKLDFTAQTAGSSTGIIWLNEDKSPVTGKMRIEFNLARDRNVYETTRMYFSGEAGLAFYIEWSIGDVANWKSTFTVTSGASKGATTDQNETLTVNNIHDAKIIAEVDSESGAIKLWINGNEFNFVTGGFVMRENDGLTKVSVAPGGTHTDPVMSFFSCKSLEYLNPDKSACELDYEALSKASLLKAPLVSDYLIDSLKLPAVGGNGSDISWSSEPSGIISDNGFLVRPASETEVTLTAMLSKGTYSTEKEFTFLVPAASSEVGGLPAVHSMVYSDDFGDGVLSDKIEVTPANGSVTEENGVLRLQKPVTSGTTSAKLFLNGEEGVTGQFVIEFILKKNIDNRVDVYLSGEGGLYSYIRWYGGSNSVIYLNMAEVPGGGDVDKDFKPADYGFSDSVKVTAFMDTETGMITYWLNNKFAATGFSRGATNFKNINLSNESDITDVTLDDFRYYTSSYAIPDDVICQLDCNSLAQENLLKMPLVSNYLIDSLNLPTAGTKGSTITWSSSSSGIINEKGWLVRPATDTDVTLTATVTKGSSSKTKNFTFKVAGKNTTLGDLPGTGDMIFSDNFDDGILGSHIVVNPGNGMVTEENGALRIQKAEENGVTGADIYLNAEKTAKTGVFVTEFIIKRAVDNRVDAYLKGSSGLFGYVRWFNSGSGSIVLALAETVGGEMTDAILNPVDFGITDTVKVTVYYDTENGLFTYWLNNKFAASGFSCGASDLKNITICNESDVTDVVLDDFRVYNASLSGDYSDRIDEDFEALTKNKILKAEETSDGYLIDSLNLYTRGAKGSRLTWTSTHPEIIDASGKLTRPKEDTNVTVTANFSYMGQASDKSRQFTFKVAGLSSQPADMPVLTGLALYDDFNDGVADPDRIVLTEGSGFAQETNGVVALSKTGAAGVTSARMYLNKERAPVTGNIFVEFNLKRDVVARTDLVIGGSGSNLALIRWFTESNGIYLNYAEEPDASYVDRFVTLSDFNAQKNLKVSVYYASAEKRLRIWLNNKLAVDGYAGTSAGMTSLYILNDSTAFSTTIDDLRLYYAQEADDVAVEKDLVLLSSYIKPGELSDGVMYKSVLLPEEGIHGSSIVWESSDPEILTADGTLNRPSDAAYSTDPTVTLKATVTSGQVSKEKIFNLTVLRAGSGDRKVAQADADAISLAKLLLQTEKIDGFVSNDLSFPSVGQFGSTITWESSHPLLISNGGVVTRPASITDSPMVTLTATVTFEGQVATKEILVTVLPLDADEMFTVIPEKYEVIYEDDFSNDDASLSHWELRPWANGFSGARNGRLETTRTENDGLVTNTTIYPDANSDKKAVEGLLAIDFSMERTGYGPVSFSVRGKPTSNVVTKMTWAENGKLSITYAAVKGGGSQILETSAYSGEVRVNVLVDSLRGTFSLWLNGTQVLSDCYPAKWESSAAVGVYDLFTAIDGDNFASFYMDDFDISYAQPYDCERGYFDSVELTKESLLTGDFVMPDTIDADLVLPNTGRYGSSITWESSNPELIDPATGAVTRPVDVAENPKVTVTATIESNGYTLKKSFDYYVLKSFSSDVAFVAADMEKLTLEDYQILSFDDPSADRVRYSLNLPSKLIFGSTISWRSSDESVLTSGGRVVRRPWDAEPATVTLTATVSYGSATEEKTFTFTVFPDEELKDPGYMTDEEFFGVWNGSSWTREGKFDYSSNLGMASVESAVKRGDYEGAKVALLEYMRNRPVSAFASSSERDSEYVDQMMLNDVWHYGSTSYYKGHGTVRSHEYETIRVPVRAGQIGASRVAFDIRAKHNENTGIVFASKEHENVAYRPRLEVIVNGATFTYYPVGDATIRGGVNTYNNFGAESELYLKMFGELQGDTTSAIELCFDLSNMPTNGIESAALVLTGKLEESYVSSKEFLVWDQPTTNWDEMTVVWGNLIHYIFNCNGVPGGRNWLSEPTFSDLEVNQAHRFPMILYGLAEYNYTEDEKYAYQLIYSMMDYIIDSQFSMTIYEWWKYQQDGYRYSDFWDWEQTIPNGGNIKRRGGYPRNLDTAMRWRSWIKCFEQLLDSRYMTPDACTLLLKNLWDCTNESEKYLLNFALATNGMPNNQWTLESSVNSRLALTMPEFKDSTTWLEDSIVLMEHMRDNGYAPDGAYGEAAGGYIGLVAREYVSYVSILEQAGKELPEGFEDFLYDAIIYAELVERDAAGIGIAWGDNNHSDLSNSRMFPDYESISKDPTYLFLDTMGAKGVAPDWTSKYYDSTHATIMRSDWTKNALHAFVDNNGVGGHGHADDNALRITAYGKNLLVDPGYFTYDDTSYRRYGTSTLAHNTVEVDSQSQTYATTEAELSKMTGQLEEWSTNEQFDVLSQISEGYPEVDHQRTVTFLKSGFWIVSDLMKPKDNNPHSYKQLWHMSPSANQQIDHAKGTIGSDMVDANIIIASDDGAIQEDMGWYTVRWGVFEEAPYAYYAKENVVGDVGFDTILFPYATQGQGSAETEAINLGVDADVATAMKITTTMDGQTSETHYMLEYEPTKGTTRTFGEFAGDGMVNVVRTDEDGNIQELILNKGTVLKRADGTVLLEVNSNAAVNVGVEMRGNTAIITTSSSRSTGEVTVNPEDVTFYASADLDNILFNDTYYEFTQNANGMISIESGTTDEVLNNDSSNNNGGIISGGSDKPELPGGTDKPDEPEQPGGNVPGATFNDVAGHWAEDSINNMAAQGIVQGDNGSFRPDASITRAELITMVVRALNLSEKGTQTGFSDVAEDSWYASYIKAALDNGIISKDTHFRPNDVVTREEMAKILAGANAIMKGETLVLPEGDTSYTDAHTISGWAQPYVLYASENGLMNGVGEGNFAPKATGTRAQVATVLDRMFTQKK